MKLLKTWIILYINLEVQAIMVIGRSSTYMFPQRRKKIMKKIASYDFTGSSSSSKISFAEPLKG